MMIRDSTVCVYSVILYVAGQECVSRPPAHTEIDNQVVHASLSRLANFQQTRHRLHPHED